MALTIFPENVQGTALTLDSIKAKLNYFELQLHEFHWQTKSFAEHEALGDLYNRVFILKDEIVEKIMGYTGTRTIAVPVGPLVNYSPTLTRQVVKDLATFAKQLEDYGSHNNYCDIENIAQSLSGDAAKTLYRLTLS